MRAIAVLWRVALVVLVVALLVLAACNPEEGSDVAQRLAEERTWYVEIDTPQGQIPCIIYDGGYDGGISCDWNPR